jgi:hypothetical protein
MEFHNKYNFAFELKLHTSRYLKSNQKVSDKAKNQSYLTLENENYTSSYSNKLLKYNHLNGLRVLLPRSVTVSQNIRTPTPITPRKYLNNQPNFGFIENFDTGLASKRFPSGIVIHKSPRKKRVVTNELLKGIDNKTKSFLRGRKTNKPILINFAKKNNRNIHTRNILFDDTVPDSIIIQSKSPVFK